MIQILVHRMVHSVTNLIEQTPGTNLPYLPSVPHTTKLTLTQPLRTANSNIQQTKMRLRRDIHTGAQYCKLDKTYALKQLLTTRG